MLSLVAAIVSSLVLCALRLDLARHIGLGDAEALFVAYGFHPQPAYVDYPGLIGWLARLIEPSPLAIHLVTAFGSTALPWAGVLAARALGSSRREALRVYFPLALLPALSIGTFAFSPDLLLCHSWLLALGSAGFALRRSEASFTGLLAWVAAGVGTALACLSQPSGWLLALGLLLVALGRPERHRLSTIAPWAAGGMFAILTAPLVAYWWKRGLNLGLDPELGVSHVLLSLARPILGVTPPFVVAAVLVARHLLRAPPEGAIDRLLRYQLLIPLVPLALLAACTRAEPDWLVPAYLVLGLQVARMPPLRPSLAYTCAATGFGVALLGWCWLRTSLPLVTGQWLGGYDPALDTSNDYYAWSPNKQLLEEAVSAAHERTGQMPVVIGPHWSICAQAEVALAGSIHVGCDSAERDDYDDWSDPAFWENAQTLLFVTDSRFHPEPPQSLYGRDAIAVHHAVVQRFGTTVRTLSVSEFDRAEGTAHAAGPRRSPTSWAAGAR